MTWVKESAAISVRVLNRELAELARNVRMPARRHERHYGLIEAMLDPAIEPYDDTLEYSHFYSRLRVASRRHLEDLNGWDFEHGPPATWADLSPFRARLEGGASGRSN